MATASSFPSHPKKTFSWSRWSTAVKEVFGWISRTSSIILLSDIQLETNFTAVLMLRKYCEQKHTEVFFFCGTRNRKAMNFCLLLTSLGKLNKVHWPLFTPEKNTLLEKSRTTSLLVNTQQSRSEAERAVHGQLRHTAHSHAQFCQAVVIAWLGHLTGPPFLSRYTRAQGESIFLSDSALKNRREGGSPSVFFYGWDHADMSHQAQPLPQLATPDGPVQAVTPEPSVTKRWRFWHVSFRSVTLSLRRIPLNKEGKREAVKWPDECCSSACWTSVCAHQYCHIRHAVIRVSLCDVTWSINTFTE